MTCAAILTDPAGSLALATALLLGVALGALAWEVVWPLRQRDDR